MGFETLSHIQGAIGPLGHIMMPGQVSATLTSNSEGLESRIKLETNTTTAIGTLYFLKGRFSAIE
jgi:hypothetical protein